VSRMKGGYGSRPRVGLTRDHTLSSRFLRDIGVMLGQWPDLVERGYGPTGVALAWLEPWDGQASLSMEALAPHFVEVCWRVRCIESADGLACLYTTTKVRRCLPEVEGGDVGDPWIPVERTDGGALTVGSSGFNYRLLTRLLFEGEFAPAAAQRLRDQDGDPMLFVASALTRGQGKTDGLHERAVVLKGKARPIMGNPDGRATLGRRASARVVAAANMRSKVLFPALRQLALNGTSTSDDFDTHVDEIFFDHLFETIDMSDDEARMSFERELRGLAHAELERAISRSSIGDSRRFRAISAAERMLQACLRKHFPDILVDQKREEGLPA
jgi:CRISPR system Cascade subunit CasA